MSERSINQPQQPARRLPIGGGAAPRVALDADQIEAEALQAVQRHEGLVLAAAKAVFRQNHDPMRAFAEAVAGAGVVYVRATIQLSAALSKRMQTAVADVHVPVDGRDRVIPAGDLLSLLGIYPADVIRFRLWAIGATCVILLATLGAGVIIGLSSVHSPALVTTTSSP